MNLIAQFDHYIKNNNVVRQQDRLLLAVSGGKDSMLMSWLFIQAGFTIEIAHCNFNLRGEESDGDEELVRRFAAEHNIVLHVKQFDTKAYAEEYKISIQMAARNLRYAWFEELRADRKLDFIAIAQHMNDHVETLLFNLSRGTGIRGLGGIQYYRDFIIRPLLFLRANDIAKAVLDYKIPYRDDSSNFSTKYARNKIRLDIIPQFEKVNPDFITIMDDNMKRFQESIAVLDDFLNELRQHIFKKNGETWLIEKDSLRNRKIGLLYLLFEPYGFSKVVLNDVIVSLDKESGRIFESNEYMILVDRDNLVLKPRQIEKANSIVILENQTHFSWFYYDFEMEISDDCRIEVGSYLIKIDSSSVIFPLVLRSWQEGDVFQPLGMKGKKKLSDLFIQRKINVLEKQDIPILVNGNGEIIWVVGLQLDDRFKITEKTKKVLKLVVNNKRI